MYILVEPSPYQRRSHVGFFLEVRSRSRGIYFGAEHVTGSLSRPSLHEESLRAEPYRLALPLE